jgi:hypothetical protein
MRNVEIVQRYDVVIGPDDAIAAVRRVVGSADGVCLRIEEQLFDATFFGLGLVPGAIHPGVRRRR